ncbi:MAG TPA: ATP-binding protein [Syntrophorhabdaceae bacterium]|nr:ATP-binding protein [Syntrophorhabdaceae bacterium]HQM79991.1 ATP-binding protein [Syntrophorhabdaceae bacterium]
MEVLSTIKVPAKLEHLHALIDRVSNCAKEQGLSEKRVNEIEIAAEEALVNIFHYAYREQEGDVEVSCKAERGMRFIIEIVDRGMPFDPLAVPEPDTTLDVAERQIGGIGVLLIKKLMDDVTYKRDRNQNILRLVVNLKA